MRSLLIMFFSIFTLVHFYGCDSSTGNSDDAVNQITVGELDTNNAGDNYEVSYANLDTVLSTFFSSFDVRGGIDFYYVIKNRLRNSKRDTSNWDTTITIDTSVSGKSGVVNYSGGESKNSVVMTEGSQIFEIDSSYIGIREVYYNYSSDSILFFGGESICNKKKIRIYEEQSVVDFWSKEKFETCSLNVWFNGKYQGNMAGTITYYLHENADDVLDSSVTASLTLTSASTKIELTESDLADYLE